jgi:hypothetical protein
MLTSALPVFQDHANSRFEGLCLLKLALAHEALGQHAEAITEARRSLPIFRRLRMVRHPRMAERILAECLARN